MTPSAYETIRYEVDADARVATVTLDRPEALNAFEMTLVGRLAAGRKQQSDNDLHIIWTVPD